MNHRNLYLTWEGLAKEIGTAPENGYLVRDESTEDNLIIMKVFAKHLPADRLLFIVDLETHDPLDRHYEFPVYDKWLTLSEAKDAGWREIAEQDAAALKPDPI